MKTKTLITQQMRTVIYLLLFVSSFAYAQPTINNPAPYRVCDDNSDGIAAFDINVITPTIITQAGTLVSYHLTLADSQAAANPIDLSSPYTNTTLFNQTLYIRAWDIADPNNPSFSTLSLVVSQKPIVTIGNPVICIGNATTVTTSPGSPGIYSYSYTVPFGVLDPGNVSSFSTAIEGSYFVTITDVVSGCVSNSAGTYVYFNPPLVVTISATATCDLNPSVVTTAGNWFNPSFSWTVPSGATDPGNVGSFSTSIIGDYSVVVNDIATGCVSNQASTTITSLASVTPTFSIQPSVCAGFILPTTSDNGIGGTWAPTVETTGTYIFTPSFGECSTIFSTLISVLPGANANQAPDLVVVDNPFDGFATFDLTSQNAIINSDSGVQIDYFPSLADAQNSSNLIANPATYTNSTNPQTIGVRVFDPLSSTCANITSFDLVINDPNNVYIPDANFKSRLISLGVDSNFDNEIQITEAAAFTNDLDASYANISDLTGIEAFINVSVLRCNNNTNLTNLNVNNLSSLLFLDCSYNQLAVLNISNLVNLKTLRCLSNLLTNLDVQPLDQLEDLNCSLNQLSSINVDSLINLKTLNCSNNQITSLVLSNMPNLDRVEYQFNQSNSITFSNVPVLKYLDCAFNFALFNLDLSALPLLEHLDCRYNSLTSINVSSLSNLRYLDCGINQLSSINVAGLNNLSTFYAYNNLFSSLDLTNLPSLSLVSVDNNQLTTLDFSGSTLVSSLSCRYNQLTTINMAGLINLNYLNCQNNQLTTLDFEGLKALVTAQCDYNLLTSLDFSTATSLQNLSCSYNNLSRINIKNGNSFINTNSFYSWSQNPILTFVCTDEAKIAGINQILNQSINVNNGNIVFNSYCSFVPGGFYNTIAGQIKLDTNNNGCDDTDLPKQFIKLNINDGNQASTFTEVNGNYKFYTPAGSFDVTPEVENPTWFSFSPTSVTVPFANVNESSTQNFCMVPIGSHQDVEVVIEPIDAAIPGNVATYKMVYRNKGNIAVSGSVNFNYNDTLLDFTSATLAPSTQSTGVLNWNYADLLPFESRSIYVTLSVNSPSTTPPVNVGTILNFSVSINPVATDENQADNQLSYVQTVVGSSVPNAITCIEGELLSPVEIGNYLHYVVNFENTGTYLAENVVVRIEIDLAKCDIATLQLLSSSHPCYTRITGNIVEFIFEEINLEARSGNPPVGGHGDVLFRIRTNSNLVNNDIVLQRAGLYFDYNLPLITNDAETVFALLSNAGFELDASVAIYPNPTNSIINVNANSNIKLMELYDMHGRILQTTLGNQKVLDITDKANGIYFVKITTEKGSKEEKIIKE